MGNKSMKGIRTERRKARGRKKKTLGRRSKRRTYERNASGSEVTGAGRQGQKWRLNLRAKSAERGVNENRGRKTAVLLYT
jgi:hypothetical protein